MKDQRTEQGFTADAPRDFIHICSFSAGVFDVRSPSGGIGLTFEDSDRFGPMKINMRTGDLSEISERHNWFWTWYGPWRESGRPTEGASISTPNGEVFRAKGPRP